MDRHVRSVATRLGSFIGRTSNRPLVARVLRSLSGESSRRVSAPEVLARCRALLSESGDLSDVRQANQVVEAYGALDADGLQHFFDLLAQELSADPAVIASAASTYAAVPSQANLTSLQHAVEPPRQELFRRINVAPSGIAALIDMRRTILLTLRDHPDRAGIDADLVHLFRSWFNRGFLRLQRIDWRTSALILERLIEYEAVHQIQGWDDLRRRLDVDRRCYAFFHPALPDEPLIFIEVALTRGMPAAIQPLLALSAPAIDPSGADSAIFYSITNCQKGLRGISFGSFLIKQVVEDLSQTFPGLATFATLSPVPGFVEWLAAGSLPWAVSDQVAHVVSRARSADGDVNPAALEPVREEVMRLCAHYLLHAKRGEVPLDAVARFHLANGARLDRLNWMGDVSPTGMTRALGVTVNYVYGLADLEKHHDAYAREHRVMASREVRRLAQPAERQRGRPRRASATRTTGRATSPRS